MESGGGGLPQRQPRAPRRHRAATASTTDPDARPSEVSSCVRTAYACNSVPQTSANDGRETIGLGPARGEGAVHVADATEAAAMAASEPRDRGPNGNAPEWASERHTGGALRSAKVDHYDFEYLDHTADIQLHAWGATHAKAFEQVALAMFNYMTPLEGIAVDESCTRTYEASGRDMHTLLFGFLDELLFVFSTELFVPKELEITKFDKQEWRIWATGRGENFDRERHTSGTEVKAITYSAMDVRQTDAEVEVFVIVDI